MAAAVSNASIVCCFITPEYENSPHCKLELQHAQTCRKRIIPCMVINRKEWKPSPSGWLGLITGSILAIDFSDSSEVSIRVRAKELIGRIKNQSSRTTHEIIPVPMTLSEPIRQQYLRKSQIKRIVNEEKSFPIERSYVNLAIVETKEQLEKETRLAEQTQGKNIPYNEGVLDTFEEIYGVKTSIDVADLFKRCKDPTRKVLVLGRAGIGKSTFCQHITYRWANGELWSEYELVVLIRLRSLTNSRYPPGKRYLPVDLVEKEYFPCDDLSNEERQHFKEKCTQGQVLWILDGYDEFTQDTPEQLRDVFTHLCETQHHILTSRPYAITSRYDVKLEIIGFTDDNIISYVEQFFGQIKDDTENSSDRARECLNLLKSKPSVWGVAHIPVNLELICSLWGDQQLSESRTLTITALYDNMTEWLCRRHLTKRSIDHEQMSKKQVYERCAIELMFLEALAFNAMRCNKILLLPTLLEETTNEIESNGLNYQQVFSMGILKSYDDKPTGNQNPIQKQHYFVHLSFQEFFAARHLIKSLTTSHTERAINFMTKYKYNQRFQLVFIFASGLLGLHEYRMCADSFWSTIQGSPLDLIGLRHIKLIIECTDELIQHSDFSQRAECIYQIANWIRISVTAEPYIITKHLIQSLQRTTSLGNQPEIQNELTKLTRSTKPKHRQKTFDILALLSITQPAPELLFEIFQALADADSDIRWRACRALGTIGKKAATKEVIAALVQALADKDSDVRQSACNALGKMSEKAATNEVIAALKHTLADGHSDVAQGAYDALGKMRDKAAINEVIATLIQEITDEDSDVRRRACRALGTIREKAATNEVIAALIRALADEISDVRQSACNALGKMGEKAATSGLIAALIQVLADDNSDVRQSACNALGKMGEKASTNGLITALIQALTDEKSLVRKGACNTLRGIGEKVATNELIAALTNALTDENSDVRESARDALETMGERAATNEVITALINALALEDWVLRQRAFHALGTIGEGPGTEEIIDIVFKALSDEDLDVRYSAYHTLGKLGERMATSEVIAALIQALADEDLVVRKYTCDALWKIGKKAANSKVIAALTQALTDEDWRVRWGGCRALRKIGEKVATREVIAALTQALTDEDWRVRSSACETLGKMGEKAATNEVIASLIQTLDDEYSPVRSSACETLGKMGEKAATNEVIAALIQALADEDSFVRWSACGTLGEMGEKAATSRVVSALIHSSDGEGSCGKYTVCGVLTEMGRKTVKGETISKQVSIVHEDKYDMGDWKAADLLEFVLAAYPAVEGLDSKEIAQVNASVRRNENISLAHLLPGQLVKVFFKSRNEMWLPLAWYVSLIQGFAVTAIGDRIVIHGVGDPVEIAVTECGLITKLISSFEKERDALR